MTVLAEPHLQMPRDTHPVPHPYGTSKLGVAIAPLLLLRMSSDLGELKEPLDALDCKVRDMSLLPHALHVTFLKLEKNG